MSPHSLQTLHRTHVVYLARTGVYMDITTPSFKVYAASTRRILQGGESLVAGLHDGLHLQRAILSAAPVKSRKLSVNPCTL